MVGLDWVDIYHALDDLVNLQKFWEMLLSVSQQDDFKKFKKNSTNCFPNFAHLLFLDSSVVFL